MGLINTSHDTTYIIGKQILFSLISMLNMFKHCFSYACAGISKYCKRCVCLVSKISSISSNLSNLLILTNKSLTMLKTGLPTSKLQTNHCSV